MTQKIKNRKHKKIYFIRSNQTKFGGAEVYLSRLTKILANKNIDHCVINSKFPNFLPSWARLIFFNIQVSFFKGKRFYFSLERIICPDVYRAGDGVHKTFLKIEKKSKLNPLHPLYLFLEKKCFKNAKKIIANSQMVKKDIIETYEVNPDKIRVVYSGIELRHFNFKHSYDKLSNEFGFKKQMSIILFVGTGFKRKGVNEFLKIIAAIESKEVVAFIVGKEKNLSYYKTLAQNLGIEKRVFFTGPRIDVNDFYSISDIFLFPTHYEPFGNVILEAMNANNIVFTTIQNGASEILSEDFLMQRPDDFSVVEKIDKLLKNPKQMKLIQENNREISSKFSIEANLERTLEIIN